MAEVVCSFNKGTFTIRPSKKASVVLRLMFLVFVTACCINICSICSKQMNLETTSRFVFFDDSERPCYDTVVDHSQIPYWHYPRPKTFNRSECERNPVLLFAIVSMQRSGSGWFETLLNSHVNVSSNGEIFNPICRRNNVSSIIKTLDQVYNMDWFTSASKNECSAAIGLKWMLNQGLMQHHEEIAQYFNDRGVNVIFLLRRNVLRRLVSQLANDFDKDAKLLNGVHVSHVHSHEEASLLSTYKPTINVISLKSKLRGMESNVIKALNYFNSTRHIIIYYEDLIKNPSPKVVEVEEFLKLPQMNLTSKQIKIHKGALSEHIKNWEEVNKTLSGTAYEKYLQADY